jgi:transposase
MKNNEMVTLTQAEFAAFQRQIEELSRLRQLTSELAAEHKTELKRIEAEKARIETEKAAAIVKLIKSEAKIEELVEEINVFRKFVKAFYERKSERYKGGVVDPKQLDLFIDQLIEQSQQVETVPPIKRTRTNQDKGDRKKHPGRHPLAADLPRIDIVIEPNFDVIGWIKIGEEITEELEIEPMFVYINRFIRPKYARPESKEAQEYQASQNTTDTEPEEKTTEAEATVESAQVETTVEPVQAENTTSTTETNSTSEALPKPPSDKNIVIAPAPIRVIDKGIPGPKLLAYMIVSKFIDHLPWHRQIEIFRRLGINIDEETANGWMKKACKLLEVIFDRMKKELLTKNYLMGDESTIKVQDRSLKGETHLGYYWVYLDPVMGLTIFVYEKGRGGAYVLEHLKGFVGTLQTDAYVGYDKLSKKYNIVLAGCWAHARRKFFDAIKTDKKRSEWFVEKIQLLYGIERLAKQNNMNTAERLELRQESIVILEEMKGKMLELSPTLLPKSDLRIAINYAINNWNELMVFTKNGNIEIDNNLVENRIRPLAIGRKNYLFAGNHEAAQRNGIIYSITATCKSLGINPNDYLVDVLDKLPARNINNIDDLLPWNWAEAKKKNSAVNM